MAGKNSGSLSARSEQILHFIVRFKNERSYSPSMREIGDAVGLSSAASVKYQLQLLEDAGYIQLEGLARGIKVLITPELPGTTDEFAEFTTPMSEAAMVPLVGRIAAGVPITAEQNVEELIPLPKSMVGSGQLFMLEVHGESMIDAAICDGDFVVCRSQNTAENGDIVAAMLDGEATVKVFKQRDGHVWLLPRNSSMEPIPGDTAVIQGKVVTVLRKL
ncbi:MAG: hypothetical protein RL672_947 [Actinomycetota bacterium]